MTYLLPTSGIPPPKETLTLFWKLQNCCFWRVTRTSKHKTFWWQFLGVFGQDFLTSHQTRLVHNWNVSTWRCWKGRQLQTAGNKTKWQLFIFILWSRSSILGILGFQFKLRRLLLNPEQRMAVISDCLTPSPLIFYRLIIWLWEYSIKGWDLCQTHWLLDCWLFPFMTWPHQIEMSCRFLLQKSCLCNQGASK